MSHSSGSVFPGGKDGQHIKTTEESCNRVDHTSTNCKSFSYCNNIDRCHSHEHKMKRLKTRKQRSKERRHVQGGHGTGAPRVKSYHRTIKDMKPFNNYCQHRTLCPPKRDAVLAQVFPAAQEPSIITDCRLIGHRGLFNHEVKSIDIERLLSEQRKKEKVTLKQKTNMTTSPFPASCLPSPGSSNDVTAVPSAEGVENEAISDTQEVCLDNEKMASHSNSQGSDITPGQRVSHQCDPNFESENPIFSFSNNPTNALPTNNKKFKPIVPEPVRKPLLTPSGDKENTVTLKKKSKKPSNSSALAPNNQEPQNYHVHRCVSSPVLVELSSSPAAGTSDAFNPQLQGSGLDSMSAYISTIAARLCHSLQLPILKRRNLLAESREMLLQALHERHGPQFQENLLRVQQCLSFTTCPRSIDEGEDKVPSTTTDTDAAWPTDAAFRVSTVKESHLDTQRTSLKGRTKQRGSNWRSTPQTQNRPQQAAESMARPNVEKVGDLLDELLKPCSSSPFCIDFLPSEMSSFHATFTIPTVSNWEVQVSSPQPWENRLHNVRRMSESAKEGCFKNSFLNHARDISSGPQQNVSSRHSSLHYSEGQLNRPPSTFRHLPQQQDLFEFDRHSRATTLSPQVCYPQESNQLHSFYHFNHPQTSSFLRSHYSNVMHYPPSHMLDKGPSPILPSLPSPEHCFFPPMRLY